MAALDVILAALSVLVALAALLVASRIPAFVQDERDHRDLSDFEVGQ
nr:hypothetical protein NG677_04485 [Methylobacterium sp. OTU13CASTA1]